MSTKDYSLTQLQAVIKQTFSNYDKQGTVHWTWETAAKDLPYQVGSLTKIILQLKGERWADGKTEQTLRAELSDELADILAEVVYIANELNIDLNEAVDLMLKSDQKKVSSRVRKE